MRRSFGQWIVWIVATLLYPVAGMAVITPINLGPAYQPFATLVVPRSDGTEFIIAAPGHLIPDATTSLQHLFSFDRSTGRVIAVANLEGEVEGVYSLSGAPEEMLASRDFRRVAVTIRTSRFNEGGGGLAIWLKDRDSGAFTLVTRRPDGGLPQESGFSSNLGGIDATGRYITFSSSASDLVPGDTNGNIDVFLFDAQTKSVTRLGANDTGQPITPSGFRSAISPDGQFVAIESASSLSPGDTNNAVDWYLLERASGALTLISRGPGGEVSRGVNSEGRWSDDGRYFSFQFNNNQPFQVDGVTARSVLYDRVTGRLHSLGAFLGIAPDSSSTSGRGSALGSVWQISPSGRYALIKSGYLLRPPYGQAQRDGLYFADLLTQEVIRVDIQESGALLSTNTDAAWIVDDSTRVLFRNRSPELGTEAGTLLHEWQPPAPTEIEVAVDGPLTSFVRDSQPRYTALITNRGTSTLDDLVYGVYLQQGLAGSTDGTTCSIDCGLPPLAPGQTVSFTFEVLPQATPPDPTQRVQFDVRVQSLSRFDRTPSNNKVTVRASDGGTGGGGSGGGGSGGGGSGGGGAFGIEILLLLAAATGALRRGGRSETARTSGFGRPSNAGLGVIARTESLPARRDVARLGCTTVSDNVPHECGLGFEDLSWVKVRCLTVGQATSGLVWG